MNEWKKVRFLDVVHLNPRISLEKGVEYPFVEMSNVVPCARKPEKDVFKKYLGEGTKFEQGDTIVARIEPCLQNGKGFQCSYKQGFGSTEFLVFRPVNINDLDCDFLYYYMGQQSIREAMAKTMVGASGRQRVNNKVFNDLQINLPPLSTQHCIANILSRYDSLIENYQKQIKLLEEAAQRLYKEWFVDLHFPGHENTKIVDGVPEGWEKKPVKTIIELQSGYAFKSSAFMEDGIYKIVTIKNVKDGAFDGENVSKIASIPEKMPKHCILEDGDILLSLTGNVGRVCIVNGKNYLLNQRVAKLKSAYKAYTYCLFRSRDMFIEVNNLANGAAQQNVSPIRIGEMKILIPEKKWLDDFERTVSNYILGIITLQSQIRFLTEARDRLLPQLMSGEIAV
ncbi:restriction endonuclease subunit S [Prevotella dentalis]|uniref:restriction endonuclease subunit S n=1 Tax=Prevotella dentalis TaxID=52227 RepID=UPI002659FAE6|nr:restriction endonuclease subunit S [Prevotella dentalis]MCF2638147.1 restriction endonuclease subunit S [Prevotella dentalis]